MRFSHPLNTWHFNFDEVRRWFRRCLEALVKNNPEAIKQCRDSSGSSFRAVLAGKIDTLKTLNVGEDEGTFDDELQYCKVSNEFIFEDKNVILHLCDSHANSCLITFTTRVFYASSRGGEGKFLCENSILYKFLKQHEHGSRCLASNFKILVTRFSDHLFCYIFVIQVLGKPPASNKIFRLQAK